MIWTVLILFRHFSVGSHEAVIKMIIKGRSPTMRHVSRTRRVALDWLSNRINLDPKIQIKYIDTKNQLADILTKGNCTRDEWNDVLCFLNGSHFSSAYCSDVMSKKREKIQVKQESQQNRVDDEVGLAMQRKDSWRACHSLLNHKARWKPDMKVNYLWDHGMSSIKEQGDLFWTDTHQVTQSGMLTRIGLLKSGNLMNWWKSEQGDLLMNNHPVCSHSTRTDKSLMTMI